MGTRLPSLYLHTGLEIGIEVTKLILTYVPGSGVMTVKGDDFTIRFFHGLLSVSVEGGACEVVEGGAVEAEEGGAVEGGACEAVEGGAVEAEEGGDVEGGVREAVEGGV